MRNIPFFTAKDNGDMTVSEVIEALTKMRELYGELPVNYKADSGDEGVRAVAAYDKNGNAEGKIVEIYIH